MLRIAFSAAVLLGFAGAGWADELDKEAPAAKQTPAVVAAAPTVGSELDQESPQAAYHHRGGWGYGGYHGYGYGGYRGYGYGGSYRPYYSGYYRPYYGGFYRPYYGGYGHGGSFINIGFGGYPYYGGYWW